uniref:Progranulin-like n=1 Tax=Gouania willdenowi TaxID=441366 RepID=A0A8C5HSU7_GOUWI
MMRMAFSLFITVLLWGSALCANKCPDGSFCSDFTTCCKTSQGFSCCLYPQAVCCSDLVHCCPSGFACNIAKQSCVKPNLPWMDVPMLEKEAAIEPNMLDLSITPFEEMKTNDIQDQRKVSVIYCDNYHTCPDGTTCCRSPSMVWSCCPYSPGKCCLDGYHCCPWGFDCDWSYQHCVRQSHRYPFLSKKAQTSFPASRISPSEDENSSPKVAD